ncbi:major facilitator superfamily transporter [Paucilactobacillus hokkaidonensis JCM 18461]|uniref:Major facilitator superfamily transporter n=3 Tax=Paucilactobacillus hokkaidonensis TaxID=1193095 RepID=A0A0A1GVZ5_9LACO|nr:major facilitator superfamily protein [Paucilactobacillus hokkaidonensis]BAP86130.1 major facilitator superfamily transporter [Paucilactobacillus hokkaidonensis JCM 18461]
MSGIDNTIINTALPAIISDLHGIELMGWIVAIFLLGTAVSTPLWSKLGEHIGNKQAYQIAAIFFVVGSFLQGMSPNIIFLIASRAVAGIGNGGLISLPYIIYASLYKNPRKRMQVLGFVSASYSMATIIGPLVGGYIVDSFSWHWVFYINVPIGLISAILVQIYYKSTKNVHKTSPVDYLGAILMTIGLIGLLSGIEMIGTTSWKIIGPVFIIAFIFLTALIYFESKAADPIIPSRLFKNRSLLIDFTLFALIWGAFLGFLTYVPMWAQGILGTTALIGGATQIPSSFTNFMGSGSVAPLRKYFTPQKVITTGIITLTLSFILLLIMGVKTPYWILLVAGMFEGFGNGMCFNELQVKVQQDADLNDIPVATSFSFLIRMLSQTFMASIFGIIMNHALYAGVLKSGGAITMKMMNKLSDAASVSSLPAHLIPAMRIILHNGLQNIMFVALVLMLISLSVNIWGLHLEKQKHVTL